MINARRIIIPLSFASFILAVVLLILTASLSLASAEPSGQALLNFPVVADFEAGTPSGWFTYGGENPTANVAPVSGSNVMSVTYNVSSFGGFGAVLSSTLGQRDWSAYNAVSFDFTGTNSGTTYNFQIQDADGGGIERWVATFTDDSTATKTVTLLFTDFVWNGFQDGSATDDGLQVVDIEAWLFDLPGTSGSFQVDNITVVNTAPPPAAFPVLTDFESGVPSGWFNYGGENPTANVAPVSGNNVMSVTYNVSSFGGFGAVLSSTLGQRDWSAYNAVSFDFTGTNSGTTYNFQIQDADGGGLERWVATFTDDSTATKTVTLSFTDFVWNGFQDGSATDDGLQVVDIEAWLFDLPGTSGSFQVDNITVVNTTPPPAAFPVLTDFESGVPSGWFNYGGENPTANVAPISGTNVMSVSYNVSSFGGFGAVLSSTLGQRDWSAYNAVSFDFTGTNSGTTYNFQIQDADGGGLERWVATFTDDSTATKTVTLLFTDFVWNGFQDGSAADDGLQVVDIEAWLFDLPATSGNFQVDNVTVVNQALPPTPFPVLTDFETGLPSGWFNYGGENPATGIAPISGTNVMSVSYNVSSFGGFGAVLTSTLGQRDWSAYNAVSFDFTGTNSGITYTFQIQDGTGAVIERFDAMFVDDSTTTKTVTIPFADFTRSTGFQDSGAPDDGLQITDMHAWVFVLPLASGSFQVDNVMVVNQAPPASVGFASSTYTVTEGGMANITVTLTATATENITVTVNSADGSAMAGSDYITVTNQLVVVPAGSMSAVFTVATTDDSVDESAETVMLTLTSSNGVPVATSSATLTIEDNDVTYKVYLPIIFNN